MDRTISLRIAGSMAAVWICMSLLGPEIEEGTVYLDPGDWLSPVYIHQLTRAEFDSLTALLTEENIRWHIERD